MSGAVRRAATVVAAGIALAFFGLVLALSAADSVADARRLTGGDVLLFWFGVAVCVPLGNLVAVAAIWSLVARYVWGTASPSAAPPSPRPAAPPWPR